MEEPRSEVFQEILDDYLSQVAKLDLAALADRLGIEVQGDRAVIPMFGRQFEVSPRGIIDEHDEKPHHGVSVVLCKYLLLCPDHEPAEGEWVAYKDFPDAAPYVGGFADTAEKPIVRAFAGRLADLKQQAASLGGWDPEVDLPYDLIRLMPGLPRVPMLLLFNDADEEFPAQCSLLFPRQATDYLDVECLAMMGQIIASWVAVAAF
jgi:hypothetical protein